MPTRRCSTSSLRNCPTWPSNLSSPGSTVTCTCSQAPCRRCGTRLQHNMPPTWRDLRNLDVYHETCRP
ncbi:hypothetical protein MRX96_036535 [Rhipicephalus microplus]